ncbi:MAG: serine/threonine-protein kinase [Myxococcota bacterium]
MRVCPQCQRVYSDGEAFCPYDGARLRERTGAGEGEDPLLGQLLDGRYRLHTVLGRGGVGTVYRAELEKLSRPVAVKVLRSTDDADEADALARFEREARAASKLGEPHIVRVYDFGRSPQGLAYLVMELLDGEDLATFLASRGRLSLERATAIVLQCCQGLGAAHRAGIVHRDLKPENIVLAKQKGGQTLVKLVDFGLAKMSDMEHGDEPGRKLTTTGMIFGTPQYMSPEQCLGHETDGRADIYGLACIFYELLVGHVPFDGDSFIGVLNQHICDPPPPMQTASVSVPAPLESLILQCLAKEPDARPASMEALAARILSALDASGQGALSAQLRASLSDAPLSFADLSPARGMAIDPTAPTDGAGAGKEDTFEEPRPEFAATLDAQAPEAVRAIAEAKAPPEAGVEARAPTVEAPLEIPKRGSELLQPPEDYAPPPPRADDPSSASYLPERPPEVSGGSEVRIVLVGLALLLLGAALAFAAVRLG